MPRNSKHSIFTTNDIKSMFFNFSDDTKFQRVVVLLQGNIVIKKLDKCFLSKSFFCPNLKNLFLGQVIHLHAIKFRRYNWVYGEKEVFFPLCPQSTTTALQRQPFFISFSKVTLIYLWLYHYLLNPCPIPSIVLSIEDTENRKMDR